MELVLIVCVCMGIKAYREYLKKEAFLADPERGRAEMEYERYKQEAQYKMANVGVGVLRWWFGK